LLNFTYNFGGIFDAMRELILFLLEDPRGKANSVHDAGFNLGLAIFFIITPNLAKY